VPGIIHARYVGFGKGDGNRSAIYVLGMNDTGTVGIFRSTDGGSTWTRVDDEAHQFGCATSVVGDPCIFSRIYVGTNGRGIQFYNDANVTNDCPDRVD